MQVVPLQDGWTRVGRSLSAHVRLDDPTVSRRHALVYRDDDGAKVLDDRSLNGVFRNGERIELSELEDGDAVAVGRFTLHFISLSGIGRRRPDERSGRGRAGLDRAGGPESGGARSPPRSVSPGVAEADGVAVVTGANRGIGLEVVRQLAELDYLVALGSRDLAKGESAARSIGSDRALAVQLDWARRDLAKVQRAAESIGSDLVVPVQLDVADTTSVDAAAAAVERERAPAGKVESASPQWAVHASHLGRDATWVGPAADRSRREPRAWCGRLHGSGKPVPW